MFNPEAWPLNSAVSEVLASYQTVGTEQSLAVDAAMQRILDTLGQEKLSRSLTIGEIQTLVGHFLRRGSFKSTLDFIGVTNMALVFLGDPDQGGKIEFAEKIGRFRLPSPKPTR